jgi:predicted ATPase/DNA-binding XRE family transcriptional regulator
LEHLDQRRRSGSTQFGDLLRGHRLRRGISQEVLAELAGVSLEAVGSLERGTRRAPHRDTVALLIVALDLTKPEAAEFEMAAARGRGRISGGASRPQAANNLSAQLSSFVGREREVREVRQLVHDHRLVTVIGAGGIGKTRLALRVAEEFLEAAFEGVWFVDFASLNEAERVPTAILSALNMPESPSRTPLDSLITYLKSRRILLIFDNCEHLIQGTAIAAKAILYQCPAVVILATSREVLGVDGERVVRLPTLPEREAVALFLDRARNADSRFEFTELLEPTIVEICRRLDGIALAIELAAARVATVSPAALERKLNERFLILTGGKRTSPSRHRTLRAMLDWSYDLLDEREQRVLRNLSVFVGGFTLELATTLSAHDEPNADLAVLDVVSSLVDKSLLQCEFRYDSARYRLLESTRQYVHEKLREHKELANAERAHALAVLALVERFSPSDFMSDRAWKTQVQPEMDNWRAALQWAFGPEGEHLIGQRLAGAVSSVWWWWSQTAVEAWRWIRQALDTCGETAPARVRAKLELAEANILIPLGRGQTQGALRAAEAALHLYQETGDSIGVAMAQIWIGERLGYKGDVSEAERLLRTALDTVRNAGAERLVALTISCLGYTRGRAGDIEAARRLIRESLEMYRLAGCTHVVGPRAFNLAEYEFHAGNSEAALSLALDAAHVSRDFNQTFSLCAALSDAAAYAVALARFDEGRSYAREAMVLGVDGGFELQIAWTLQHLAAITILGHDRTGGPREAHCARAARTLGFVDARIEELKTVRSYTERQEYDKMLEALRAEPLAELEELMREGAHWSKERALEQWSM